MSSPAADGALSPGSPERLAPSGRDVVLGLAVAGVLGAIITIAELGAGRPPAVAAYLFAIGFGAVLLLRRALPRGVLVLSVLGTFAYYTLQLPTIGVALPVTAAVFSAAERGLLRWAVGAAAVVLVVAVGFRLRDDTQPLGYLLGTDAVTNLALLAAAVALGAAVRARRRGREQQAQIAALQERQARREAELRLRAERERISRELHDTVGHSFSVISLHAGVAADAVGHDDAAVRDALTQVRTQSRDSLQELRAMVRLLREAPGGGEDDRHVRSLADLPALLDGARAAGIAVSDRVEVGAGDLSPAVHSAAYRIVQEAVTNVLRHAEARTLTVRARVAEGRLLLEVHDDGRGADPARIGDAGMGVQGMRERARLLGGELRVATAPGDGFHLTASLPARLPGAGSEGGVEGRGTEEDRS